MKHPSHVRITPSEMLGRRLAAPGRTYLWRAELVGTGIAVHGFDHPLEALGALAYEAAEPLGIEPAAFDVLASFFADRTKRNANLIVGRAIWYANKSKFRKEPGCTVEIVQAGDARLLIEQPVSSPRRKAVKGGAA